MGGYIIQWKAASGTLWQPLYTKVFATLLKATIVVDEQKVKYPKFDFRIVEREA